MKRAFLIVCLLIASSSLFAAERYTEVWNPPEAQAATKAKSKTHGAAQTASKKKRKTPASTTVKQVADKAAIEQSPAPVRPKATSPRQSEPVIPRKIEPNGQVMRV
ncbi:hypothetical protein AWB79_06821 [Caballeronia hypogeia]|uniref:Uncharacterized protein n=1 Tax=Caballeronia hypogeia TaxID=1777140 RepID=A0A158DD76_9BURK|nr:hypothetical protein [Caballeronia hypogeia]SAK92491.1 hypothetical protein AWB79_06821 [Caballeronia hypogeia]